MSVCLYTCYSVVFPSLVDVGVVLFMYSLVILNLNFCCILSLKVAMQPSPFRLLLFFTIFCVVAFSFISTNHQGVWGFVSQTRFASESRHFQTACKMAV